MPRIAQKPLAKLSAEHRNALQAALDSGRVHDPCMILTYAQSERLLKQVIAALPTFPHMGFDATFGADFCELLRLRSAQLAGCDSCQQARYEESSEELLCKIAEPSLLPERESVALRFLTMMHLDYRAIDEAFFCELAKVFSASEIIELGVMVSQMVGGHRLLSVLDMYGTNAPVVAPGATRAPEGNDGR